MNEWKERQNAENVTFIPDGNGAFTDGMGLLVDKEDLGFGKRSWRYSMLVRDGIVEKMFVESQVPGDPFEVSDADTMFAYIAPGKPKPLDVVIFSRPGCAHCGRAKEMLRDAGIPFDALELNQHYLDRALRAVSAATTWRIDRRCRKNRDLVIKSTESGSLIATHTCSLPSPLRPFVFMSMLASRW